MKKEALWMPHPPEPQMSRPAAHSWGPPPPHPPWHPPHHSSVQRREESHDVHVNSVQYLGLTLKPQLYTLGSCTATGSEKYLPHPPPNRDAYASFQRRPLPFHYLQSTAQNTKPLLRTACRILHFMLRRHEPPRAHLMRRSCMRSFVKPRTASFSCMGASFRRMHSAGRWLPTASRLQSTWLLLSRRAACLSRGCTRAKPYLQARA